MHHEEVARIEQAVQRLEAHGIHQLVVVPLLISSASEVMRQYQYLFGLRAQGPWNAHAHPIMVHVPVIMTPPLDDDPLVAEIVLERAKAVSQEPSTESIILIAHGPTGEEDNQRWLETMGRLAKQVQAQGQFRAVVPVTMRDDAPRQVRQAATRAMRTLVKMQSAHGSAIVVPLLLANGGIEQKIPKRLAGLTYTFQSQALLPHPKVARWIARQVREAVVQPQTWQAVQRESSSKPETVVLQ